MERKYFEGFDFADFWSDSEYSINNYQDDVQSDEQIKLIEDELGYILPESYKYFMSKQNGGIPKKQCFPTETATSWADNHVAISGLLSIGRKKIYSLCGDIGSEFMIDEWGYPNIGVMICNCPSAGHDIIMLDYRNCGKDGEPEVVHIDQEIGYRITVLAKDFETFILNLIDETDLVFD